MLHRHSTCTVLCTHIRTSLANGALLTGWTLQYRGQQLLSLSFTADPAEKSLHIKKSESDVD